MSDEQTADTPNPSPEVPSPQIMELSDKELLVFMKRRLAALKGAPHLKQDIPTDPLVKREIPVLKSLTLDEFKKWMVNVPELPTLTLDELKKEWQVNVPELPTMRSSAPYGKGSSDSGMLARGR